MTTNLNFMIQMYFQAVTSLLQGFLQDFQKACCMLVSFGLGAEGCPLLHNAVAKILKKKNMPIHKWPNFRLWDSNTKLQG